MYAYIFKEDMVLIFHESKYYFHDLMPSNWGNFTGVKGVNNITKKVAKKLLKEVEKEITFSEKGTGKIISHSIKALSVHPGGIKDGDNFSILTDYFGLVKDEQLLPNSTVELLAAFLALKAEEVSYTTIYHSEIRKMYIGWNIPSDIRKSLGFQAKKKKEKVTTNVVEKCHYGNVETFPGLFFGGLTRGVNFKGINLAIPLVENFPSALEEIKFKGDNEKLKKLAKISNIEVLHLPIQDYSTPSFNLDWEELAKVIHEDYLAKDKKVVIFCQGGHGRTGLVGSIIVYFLAKLFPESYSLEGKNSVEFLRDKYCEKIVETQSQIDYIQSVTGEDLSEVKTSKSIGSYWYGYVK